MLRKRTQFGAVDVLWLQWYMYDGNVSVSGHRSSSYALQLDLSYEDVSYELHDDILLFWKYPLWIEFYVLVRRIREKF